MRLLFLFFAILPFLPAQPFGSGIKGGLPLSEAFKVAGEPITAQKSKWIYGPYFEVRLPARFAIEVDALHEDLHFDYRVAIPILGLETARTTASTWQFPLLLKYRMSDSPVRPFVSGGIAVYRVAGVRQTGEVITQLPSEIRNAISRVGNTFVNGGGVVAGGVEFKLGPLRIAPEVRFTRWTVGKSVGTEQVSLRLNQSQTQFLVGIGF